MVRESDYRLTAVQRLSTCGHADQVINLSTRESASKCICFPSWKSLLLLMGSDPTWGSLEFGSGSWPQSSRHGMTCGDGHAHCRAQVQGPSSHVIFPLRCVAPEINKIRIVYQGGDPSLGQDKLWRHAGRALRVNTQPPGVQGNVSNHRSQFHEDIRHHVSDRRSCQTHCRQISSCRERHSIFAFIFAASVQNGGTRDDTLYSHMMCCMRKLLT